MLQGGRNSASKYHWRVWGSAHSVWATLGLPPAHSVYAFLVYTAQAPGCSAGDLSKAGPGLHAHPRSKPFRFSSQVLHKGADSVGPVCCTTLSGDQVRGARALSSWGGMAYRLPRPSCSVSWVRSGSTVSGVLCVSSGELISGCDPPGRCQPSRIPGRLDLQLGACSQFGSGCLLPSWLWLLPACLAASGEGWASLLPGSSPLVFSQSCVL